MDNSSRNMIIGIVVFVVIVTAIGLGVGLGMKKDPEPIQLDNTSKPTTPSNQGVMPPQIILPPVNIPAPVPVPASTDGSNPSPLSIPPTVNSLTPLPDIQPGFKPTIVQVGPIDPNNVLGVKDEGYGNSSTGPYQFMSINQMRGGTFKDMSQTKNSGYFLKGTYSNIGTNRKTFCREVGQPKFVSCGVPGNPYKYMPPNAQSGPISDPGYEAFRGMFIISGTGDERLDGRTLFCRGVGNDPENPQMSCIGLNVDGSWNYANQNMGIGKLGNALDYFKRPLVTGGVKPPPPPILPPVPPPCGIQ